MKDPSSQLLCELKEASTQPTDTSRRPILWHINADTTWLLSLPYPEHAVCPPWRSHFNILIDPWLRGPQSDVASWFSTQWHKIDSSVETIEALNRALQDREDHEAHLLAKTPEGGSRSSDSSMSRPKNYIDVVVCSHEFSDHCHQGTLEEIDPSVPCLATTKAAELIRSWGHFKYVHDVPVFGRGCDWRKTTASFLPAWIGIGRIVTDSDALYLHSAVAIFLEPSEPEQGNSAEAVIYTPHGIRAADLISISEANPPVQTLALLHGLHEVFIPFIAQLSLGANNALKCQKILKSKYWVSTHDEVKIGWGIITPFLRRKPYTLADALRAQEDNRTGAALTANEANYLELGSGEMLVLRQKQPKLLKYTDRPGIN